MVSSKIRENGSLEETSKIRVLLSFFRTGMKVNIRLSAAAGGGGGGEGVSEVNSTKSRAKFLHVAFSLVFIGIFLLLEVNVDIL